MVIRKLRQKKILNTKRVSLLILFGAVIYLLVRLGMSLLHSFQHVSLEGVSYTLWSSHLVTWQVIVDNNFPHYTHSLLFNGTKIWLKSSSINLNTYTNVSLELVWIVKKYIKHTPIFEVKTLKLPNQWLILQDNIYFFVQDLMYLDFSSQPQMSAIKSWWLISLFFDDQKLLDVERFSCSKILNARDCTSLITNYIKTNKPTFDTYRGYTFYKHFTGSWITFDSSMYGFLFKDVTDDLLLDIANMFRIVNKSFVLEHKMESVRTYCQDAFSQIHTIDIMEWTFSYMDPYTLVLSLVWTDMKKNPATCKISFDVWNNWEVVDAEYMY